MAFNASARIIDNKKSFEHCVNMYKVVNLALSYQNSSSENCTKFLFDAVESTDMICFLIYQGFYSGALNKLNSEVIQNLKLTQTENCEKPDLIANTLNRALELRQRLQAQS